MRWNSGGVKRNRIIMVATKFYPAVDKEEEAPPEAPKGKDVYKRQPLVVLPNIECVVAPFDNDALLVRCRYTISSVYFPGTMNGNGVQCYWPKRKRQWLKQDVYKRQDGTSERIG